MRKERQIRQDLHQLTDDEKYDVLRYIRLLDLEDKQQQSLQKLINALQQIVDQNAAEAEARNQQLQALIDKPRKRAAE